MFQKDTQKSTQKIDVRWAISVHSGWFSLLCLVSIIIGFESILILTLLNSDFSKSTLAIPMIVMIRLLKYGSPFFTQHLQNYFEQAFDNHFFNLSKLWSQLKIRKPEFHQKFSKAIQQSENFTQQFIFGLLPGITQTITMVTLLLWFSNRNTSFNILLILIIVLEVFLLISKSRNNHEHSTQNLELFREYSYLKYQLTSHKSLREFQAYSAIDSLRNSCLQKLSTFQKTKLNLLRSNSMLSIAVRTIQLIGVLVYFLSRESSINITSFGVEQLGLAYAVFRALSTGTKMAGLAGQITAIRLSSREINRLTGDFISVTEDGRFCKQIIADLKYSEAKRIISLNGKNGSGKSSLILELIDHRQKFTSLHTGILFQDFTLFQASILNNILLFSPPPDKPDKIHQALESSGFSNCMREYGWDLNTRIGDEFSHGRGISMGEWQKLALARAIYHGQDLLILDEPETFLDICSRQKLLSFLKNTSIPIIILISHANEFKQLAHKSITL